MKPQRKTTRLQGYDYRRAGAYFCTICVHRRLRRRAVWGHIEGDIMHLNRFGRLVWDCWRDLPDHHQGLTLDEFVVMPNHIHLIIFLTQDGFEEPCKAGFGPLPSASLSSAMGGFKSAVTRAINKERLCATQVWQERFYERIIRDEEELNAIRKYIGENPAHWPCDVCHPDHPNFENPWRGLSPDP